MLFKAPGLPEFRLLDQREIAGNSQGDSGLLNQHRVFGTLRVTVLRLVMLKDKICREPEVWALFRTPKP